MFTLNLDENCSVAPPPLPESSSAPQNISRGPTPSNLDLPPASPRASQNFRLDNSNSDVKSKFQPKRENLLRRCKSGEFYNDSNKRCLSNDSYCPFVFFKDYAKGKFGSTKPPLPVPKTTEEVRPATPVLQAPKDHNNNGIETYQNVQEKFLQDIRNARPTKMAPSVELSPKSRPPFGPSGPFAPTEPKEPLKAFYGKEEEFRRNLIQFDDDDDVCSSGLFLLGDRGANAVARAADEAPRQLSTDKMRFAKSHEMIDVKYPQTTEFPSSTMSSGLQSLETLQKLKKAASDSCRLRSNAGQIPNEIQDDMLRIEMLLELRKYKRALSAQIQAQQRLIHMCSDQNLPSEQLASSLLPSSMEHPNHIEDQPQKEETEANQPSVSVQSQNEENARASTSVEDEKPWEADLARQMLGLSFMEPHFSPHVTELPRMTQQNPFPETNDQFWLTPPPRNQTPGKNCQIYGERKSNLSQPKGQILENSYKLILGKGQPLEGLQNFSQTGGVNIADSSKWNEANQVPSISPESTLFHDMLRKPVSVSISKPRGPSLQADFFHPEAPSIQGSMAMATLQLQKQPGENPSATPQLQKQPGEKPSPFFPGLSGQIDMKIQIPQQVRSQSFPGTQQKGGDIDGELEELSKLLSQLPVISRQQQAEEFASKPVIPATPVTDPESDTSMVPHVSSIGTVATSDRPEGDDRNQTTEEDEEMPLRSLDTNKMSVSELVTLGKKIYKILSQLSTKAENSRTRIDSGDNVMKSPSVASSRNGNYVSNNNVLKRQSKSATGARLQDNRSASSFVTGLRPIVGYLSRPSNPLQRAIAPPPIRWTKKSESLSQATMNSIGRQQRSMQKSTTSIQSGLGTHKPSQAAVNNKRSILGIGDEKNVRIPTSTRSSRMKMRYSSNNFGYVNPITNRYQRQLTPRTLQLVDELNSSTTTLSRDKRKGRNFIQENIVKARLVRRFATSVSPKPLPPVPKIYENIQSVVNSRSRSGERDRSTSTGRTTEDRRRATSLPPIREQRSARRVSPVRYTFSPTAIPRQRTGRSGRPSTTNSVASSVTRSIRTSPTASRANLVDLKHQVSDRLKVVNQILTKSSSISKGTINPSLAKKIIAASKASLKTNSVESTSKLESDGKAMSRKSRSKTKRDSQIAKELRIPTFPGMSTENMKITDPKSNGGRGVGGSGKVIAGIRTEDGLKNKIMLRKTNGTKTLGDARYFDIDPAGENKNNSQNLAESVFTTFSEQQLIREMVKTEMNRVVENHARDVMKQKKTDSLLIKPETKQPKMKEMAVPPSDESEFEHITPICTPPRQLHDESLFFIEKWINPEGSSYPTSAKDTPQVSEDTEAEGSGADGEYSKRGKAPTVRFSLPAKQSRKLGK